MIGFAGHFFVDPSLTEIRLQDHLHIEGTKIYFLTRHTIYCNLLSAVPDFYFFLFVCFIKKAPVFLQELNVLNQLHVPVFQD